MFAKFAIKLPFSFLVPEGAGYPSRGYRDEKYLVHFKPPARTESADDVWTATLDDQPAFLANVLVIEFHAAEFDRTLASEDPPKAVINRAIAELLTRLRYATKSQYMVDVDMTGGNWRLDYLEDDGSELAEEANLVRGRVGWGTGLSWTLCTPDIWESALALDSDDLPPWRSLLTDANAALPHVGTAVVLAATSLEVMISDVLARLQPTSQIQLDVWEWISDRSNRQFNPTVEEQWSGLLAIMCGHSLKERSDLWQRYANLRTARNSFVHRGVASVAGTAVTRDEAKRFIECAEAIGDQVRDWLPEDKRWPRVQLREIRASFSRPLGAAPIPPADSDGTVSIDAEPTST
ncbi:hypothetical protein [Pseudoxanthomonas mexicana]